MERFMHVCLSRLSARDVMLSFTAVFTNCRNLKFKNLLGCSRRVVTLKWTDVSDVRTTSSGPIIALMIEAVRRIKQHKVKQSHNTPMDAQGERGIAPTQFFTSDLDGGEWSAALSGRTLAAGKGPPVPIVQEAGWALEPVWTQRIEENRKNPLPLPGIEPRSLGRPGCSQTLYWLSYSVPIILQHYINF
jgi:hypothetical protein